MRLRLYLVAKGVEHYYLGPLGCPEMATTISNYKERFGSADIVFASPPCQDFSLVNPARESSSCWISRRAEHFRRNAHLQKEIYNTILH